MPAAADDWRRMGQEADLPPGTLFVLRPYRARTEDSEHEHCVFCFAKFMDPHFSDEHRRFIDEHADVRSEGFVAGDEHCGSETWVCPGCFEDFADEMQWRNAAR